MNAEEKLLQNFDTLLTITSSTEFLNRTGLGGELPFWIAPYDIQCQDLAMQELVHLVQKLHHRGISILLIDLFELSISLLKDHIGLDNILLIEKKKSKEKFRKALQSTLNLHERFIPRIAEAVQQQQPQVLMLKGVAAVYPFIRSHNVLNNLHTAIPHIPTLMFFPGEYNGKALNLFGNLKDDNYYRAFNIFEHKINSLKQPL